MQVFYVNIGGGEPTIRGDFWEIVDYAVAHHVGVKFSTNGSRITAETARRIAGSDYLDVQISLDGATPRGQRRRSRRGHLRHRRRRHGAPGRRRRAGIQAVGGVHPPQPAADRRPQGAGRPLRGAGCGSPGCRPSGRGADVWGELHPTADQQQMLHRWLLARGEEVLTGDSFFHLAGYGQPPPRPEPLRRRARRVPHRPCRGRLRLPVRHPRGVPGRQRARRRRLRAPLAPLRTVRGRCANPQATGACGSCSEYDGCRGGCMAAKFFTGLPLAGPDPECVKGHGATALAAVEPGSAPRALR